MRVVRRSFVIHACLRREGGLGCQSRDLPLPNRGLAVAEEGRGSQMKDGHETPLGHSSSSYPPIWEVYHPLSELWVTKTVIFHWATSWHAKQ